MDGSEDTRPSKSSGNSVKAERGGNMAMDPKEINNNTGDLDPVKHTSGQDDPDINSHGFYIPVPVLSGRVDGKTAAEMVSEMRGPRLSELKEGHRGEEVVELERVWVFHGKPYRFPSGIFTSPVAANFWIAQHRLSGCLAEYPVNTGLFDWAVAQGHHKPKAGDETPKHIANFHQEDGRQVLCFAEGRPCPPNTPGDADPNSQARS